MRRLRPAGGFRLLDLPREVRDVVYGYVIEAGGTGIGLVSKLVWGEVGDLRVRMRDRVDV